MVDTQALKNAEAVLAEYDAGTLHSPEVLAARLRAVLALFKAAPEVERVCVVLRDVAVSMRNRARYNPDDRELENDRADVLDEAAALLRSQAAQIADLTTELARKNIVIDAYVEMVQSYKDEIDGMRAKIEALAVNQYEKDFAARVIALLAPARDEKEGE